MKVLKIETVCTIIIMAFFYACGSSDDNNNPETEEENEIRPISELSEDPDFIKFMELYYFPEQEIPDLQAAYDLRIAYENEGLFTKINREQFEKLALAYGYSSAQNLIDVFLELSELQQKLESKYEITTVDSDTLAMIELKVVDDLYLDKADTFFVSDKGFQKNEGPTVEEMFSKCNDEDYDKFINNRYFNDEGDNEEDTCYGEAFGRIEEIKIEYGPYNRWYCDIAWPDFEDLSIGTCVDERFFSWRLESMIARANLRCCLYFRCELEESFPEEIDNYCKNECTCS